MGEKNPVRARLQQIIASTPGAQAPAAPVEKPAAAPTPTVTPEAQAAGFTETTPDDIEGLKAYLDERLKGKENPPQYDFKPGAVSEEGTNIQRVAEAIGVKARFFEGEGAARAFNGLYEPTSGTIFINAKTDKPYLVILGHETLHRLHTEHQDLWSQLNELTKDLREEFDSYLKDENASRKKHGLSELSAESMLAQQEYMADFVGQQFANPKFWEKLNARNPTWARKLRRS